MLQRVLSCFKAWGQAAHCMGNQGTKSSTLPLPPSQQPPSPWSLQGIAPPSNARPRTHAPLPPCPQHEAAPTPPPLLGAALPGRDLTRLGRAWATTTATAGLPRPPYLDNLPRFKPSYRAGAAPAAAAAAARAAGSPGGKRGGGRGREGEEGRRPSAVSAPVWEAYVGARGWDGEEGHGGASARPGNL